MTPGGRRGPLVAEEYKGSAGGTEPHLPGEEREKIKQWVQTEGLLTDVPVEDVEGGRSRDVHWKASRGGCTAAGAQRRGKETPQFVAPLLIPLNGKIEGTTGRDAAQPGSLTPTQQRPH